MCMRGLWVVLWVGWVGGLVGEGVVVCGRMKIGNTPLIRLNRISDETGCEIYGKVTTSL